MSIERIRAAAWGERTVSPNRASSAQRSEPKANRPRTFGTPSGRGTLVPMRGGALVSTGATVSVTGRAPPTGGHPNRLDDPSVAGAPAQVPRDRLADLRVGGGWAAIEQVVDGHHQARCAEPA